MMDKISKIKELIPFLDEQEDFFLIDILNNTIRELKHDYKSKHSVTKQEIGVATGGIKRTLKVFLNNEDKVQIKISKIIKRSGNCNACKFSQAIKDEDLVYYMGSFTWAEDSERCKRCFKRCEFLESICKKRIEENNRCVKNALENNNELIKYKAIINKINLKLNNNKLKLKNYATS